MVNIKFNRIFLLILLMLNIFLICCNGQKFSATSSLSSTAPSTTPNQPSTPTGNNYFVKTSGSDSNPCTLLQPCLTVSKAVSVAIAPATVNIGPGLFVENAQIVVAPLISLVGTGLMTVIKSGTATQPLISLMSNAEGVVGNQSISNLTIDGNNLLGLQAVYVRGRSGVEIHHIMVKDFLYDGVTFSGIGNEVDGPPTIYATGNSFHDNTVINSSVYSGYGHGALQIGGQDGIQVYNNSIDQTGRATGSNGYCIKLYRLGYLKGAKIHDNVLTKVAMQGGGNFEFTVELWNVSGVEMYNNISTGSFDISNGNKNYLGTNYPYSYYAHHNIIGFSTTPTTTEVGINLEATILDLQDVIISNNFFRNVKKGVYFYLHNAGIGVYNTTISNNIFYKSSALIVNSGNVNAILNGVYFRNNTIWNDSTSNSPPYNGYDAFDGGITCQQSNYFIENNIVVGSARSFMFFWNGAAGKSITGVTIRNNIIYGNGNNSPYIDNDAATTAAISGRTAVGNITVAPLFLIDGIDFHLAPGSPAINAGYANGLMSDYDGYLRSTPPDIGAFQYH